MAKIGVTRNGVKRRSTRRKNGAARAATVKAKNPAKRRSLGLASVKSFAKRNGLKLVSKSAQNPKRKAHKRKRRNGLATIPRSRNGIFGNTKHDAKQVLTLIGGMAGTKLISKFITPYLSPLLAKIGIGNYSTIIVDGAVALLVVPAIAAKIVRGGDTAKLARLGGMVIVGLDLIDEFAPAQFSMLNPFASSAPIVINNGAAAMPLPAVAQLVNSTSATDAEKAAVGRALMNGGGMPMNNPNPGGANGGMNLNQMLPVGVQ